jgi:hypothetical protein
VEPLPLQVFPRDDSYNGNFLQDDDDEDDDDEGRVVMGLQIMMGQQGLLEVLAQGDLFI